MNARQRIRFCTTSRGRIAYSLIGNGPVLLCDTGWVSHLEKDFDNPAVRQFFESLAAQFTVVRYDKPGSGLSDRDAVGECVDDQVRAMAAVADEIGADNFHAFGASQGGQVAAALAARHPDRVMKLVLYGACARGIDLAPENLRNSLVALVGAHWGLGSKTLADVFIPDASAEEVAMFSSQQRAASSAEVAAALLDMYYSSDIGDLLPAVAAPTLVLHREEDRATRFALGRDLASRIPGAVLVPLEGSSHLFYIGDWQAISELMIDFLREPSSAHAAGLSQREREVATLVAEGLTSREIGSRLSISPRTAETHVENLRRKLGFRSRSQVAAWAAGQRS